MNENRIELSGIFSEGYGVVPKKLMKAQDINSNTKLIICYLLSYTGTGLSCFPSLDLIANDLNISKRTIIRCINECVKNGYIHKEQIQRGRGIGKQNIYHLLFMQDYASDKKSPAKVASDKKANASDKNDKLQVTPGNCNNNSNNNIYNNKHFLKPSLIDIKNYIQEKQWTVNAERWLAHYESNGWLVGKNKMKDWKACVKTWQYSDFNKKKKPMKELTQAQKIERLAFEKGISVKQAKDYLKIEEPKLFEGMFE